MATDIAKKSITRLRRRKNKSPIIGGIRLGVGLKSKFLKKCNENGVLPTRVITTLVTEWITKEKL